MWKKKRMEHDSLVTGRLPRDEARPRACNLCGEIFFAANAHFCFCEECKKFHELYRFHDWLPDELRAA